ncbi:MAG: M48 family metalloprotease [Thermoplasmatota archaeon]
MAERMLEDQIRHNKAVTTRLFVVLFLILFAIVFAVGVILHVTPWVTAGFALVFGLFYLWMASSFSIPAILASARARPANPNVREERLLMMRVEEMAIASGLPLPKVYIQEDDDINAFATGKDPKESIVCVTTGALRALDQEELQGVIGHEMSHIRNYDIRVTTYAIALIGLIAMVGEMVIRSVFWGGSRRGRGEGGGGNIVLVVIAIAFVILAPILSRLVYFAISRRREYLADASGVQLTRNPEGLRRALEKIAGTQPQPGHGDRTVASLYLDNPFRRGLHESPWSTHPPIQKRIERLREM